MKKILTIFLLGVFLFAANESDIDKKLDLILQKLNYLEKQEAKKDAEIKQLKEQINQQIKKQLKKEQVITKKQLALQNCKNIKVVSFSYQYHDEVLPYYTFEITLKNNYPYTIKRINGNVYFDDKNDGTTFVKALIKRNVTIKPNGEVTIKREYMITSELEKELKDEKPSQLHVYFDPTKIEFQNGKRLECY